MRGVFHDPATDPTMCLLATVTFVMAMLVCFIWAIPGVFTNTVVVAPNDTIMAAFDVDSQVTANIVYSLKSTSKGVGEGGRNIEDGERLLFYRERCDVIDRFSSKVDSDELVDVPADAARMEISRLYLATDSSLDYTVDLSLSSLVEAPPSSCYASLLLFRDYFALKSFVSSNDSRQAVTSYDFCNATRVSFSLDVEKSSYFFLALYVANLGQVESADVRVRGTVFYYNSSLYEDKLVCTLAPPINSTCQIHMGDETDHANDNNMCILITRGTPNIPGTVATGNRDVQVNSVGDNVDDIIQFERRRTTFWGTNRTFVFVCLFIPILLSSCVLALLTLRQANYGAYIRNGRRKKTVN